METILFLAHPEGDGRLARATLEALAATKALSESLNASEWSVGLVGENVQEAANSIAGCGTGRVIGVSGGEFAQSRYASDAAAVQAIVAEVKPTLILAPSTSRWSRVMPGLAHRLGGTCDTHVAGISSDANGPSVCRWYYRQRIQARVRRKQRPWFILLDPGCQPAIECAAGQAKVVPVSANLQGPSRTEVRGVQTPAATAQTIRPDAKLLFVTGAGWTKKQADGQTHVPEAERIILEFVNRSHASLGSSKSLVDLSGEGQAVLSFLSHLNQVGQTGSTPRHPKGLATCCHGEEPHTVGWRFIGERRAISLDPNCGWARGKADVVYVADAFAVMRRVNEVLAEAESCQAS